MFHKQNFITPCRNSQIDEQNVEENTIIRNFRGKIEGWIGHLKGKFGVLQKRYDGTPNVFRTIVLICCAIYNLYIFASTKDTCPPVWIEIIDFDGVDKSVFAQQEIHIDEVFKVDLKDTLNNSNKHFQ